MRVLLTVLFAAQIAGYAHAPTAGSPFVDDDTAESCAAMDADLIASHLLLTPAYKEGPLACDKRTHEESKTCTGVGRECQGACLAPAGSVRGQSISRGMCAPNLLDRKGALRVFYGKVVGDQDIQF